MQLESLQKFFASSPAVRLIRSPHAFWIVDFLNQQFKVAGQITVPHSQIASDLDAYLERLARSPKNLIVDGKSKSQEKADTYLSTWCSGSIGWLKRFIPEDASEPCYQLTAEFEKALAFVDKASREVSFVGTESRLRTILEVLSEVVVGVSADPKARLQQLQQQQAEIAREISRLQAEPLSNRLSATAVKERFALATSQLRQLKSEFRTVEDRFKSITRSVQQKILSANETRGDILQFALDSEDMLKHGDQGQSFFEFLKLLHSPDSQDRIALLIEQLSDIEVLANESEELMELRSMVPTLIAEAEKILRTTQHLSLTLRRLLDSRSTRHHQQLSQVLRDILSVAAQRSENPPADVGIDVEVEIEIQCPMDRPFWAATEPFDDVELQTVEADAKQQAAAFEQLIAMERIDWAAMRGNISSATEPGDEVSLTELLDRFPIQTGAIEVLGYLQIAFDDGHRIDRTTTIELPAGSTGPSSRRLSLPNIVFLPKTARRKPALNDHAPHAQKSESLS